MHTPERRALPPATSIKRIRDVPSGRAFKCCAGVLVNGEGVLDGRAGFIASAVCGTCREVQQYEVAIRFFNRSRET